MHILPSYSDFKKRFDEKKSQLVWTECVIDTETPVSTLIKLSQNQENIFLFESIEGGRVKGRYSFIGLEPDMIWRYNGVKAELNKKADKNLKNFEQCSLTPIESLRRIINESLLDIPQGLPPMSSGLFGYLGYDFIRQAEKLENINEDKLNVPDGIFLRPSLMIIFDHVHGTMLLTTPVWSEKYTDSEKAYLEAKERLSSLESKLIKNINIPPVHIDKSIKKNTEIPVQLETNIKKETFLENVQKAKKYIEEGDIFQVVLSQRFKMPFHESPLSFYRSLRHLNPSPFLFYFCFNGFSIVGSSPEILVRLRDNKVTIRPIAGTRKRGETAEKDRELSQDLLSDEKELAEHLMLLDLSRNDVGRVSKIGSVNVTEKNIIEYYSHVMHIVSNVEGEIDPKYDVIDTLLAGFPAGTVSGAPKIRAMEIIDELETEKRNIYAGSIGYFSSSGQLDTCIALRTAVIKDQNIYIQAGAGIVADSDPEAEHQECLNKATALFKANSQAKYYEI